MSNKESLAYIDPFSKIILKRDGADFKEIENIPKGYIVGSRVGHDDLITHSFKIHSSISKDDLDLTVELRMYEDAGLDSNRDYKMVYVKKELDYEDSLIVEVFAIDIEETKEKLSFVLDNSKRLDFLAIPSLSFETFYINKILKPQKDVFVYMGIDEAFLSVYQDGKYLSSSSLDTLNEMLKAIQSDNIDINLDSLRDILKTKGLDKEKYDSQDMQIFEKINTVFSNMFYKINNIAIHNRSVFGFNEIERIFFSSVDGRVFGLKEFIGGFGFGESVELHDFNLFKDSSKKNYFEKISFLYIEDKIKSRDNSHNITFVEKSKPWIKTSAGKFILFFIISMCAFSSYPLYLLYSNSLLQTKRDSLQLQYRQLQSKTMHIKQNIANKKMEIKKVKSELSDQSKKIENIVKSIDELVNLTAKKSKNYQTIITINKVLKRYKLRLKSYEQKDNSSVTLEIIAKYKKRDAIAKFMKDLIKDGFVEVSTKEIKLDNEKYISKIEIYK